MKQMAMAREIAQYVEAHTTLEEDLSSVPSIYIGQLTNAFHSNSRGIRCF